MDWHRQKVLLAITRCRTATLGGHRDQCSHCDITSSLTSRVAIVIAPKCEGNARHRWLEARQRELLPTPYVPCRFTLPRELAHLALQNKNAV